MIFKLFPQLSLLLFYSPNINALNNMSLRVKRSNLIVNQIEMRLPRPSGSQ
jgi:hypothetical protein